MANIFDGIKALSEDELRMEVALFSRVNFANAAKETGNKIIGALAELSGAFMKSLGGKTDVAYDVVRVTDMVAKEMEALYGKDREWLETKLRELLIAKLGMTSNVELSNDAISVKVVREAASTYGVEKYDTFANKLEKVGIEYNKALLSTLHSLLVNQNQEEARATDRMLQKALDRISIDDKRNLQRLIMPKEFSGAGVGRVLRLERDVKNLTYTVDILGLSAFDEVLAHTSTVVGAVKVLRSMSRVLCAQLVWMCVSAYKGMWGVDEKLLPSHMSDGDKIDNDIIEKNFRGLIAKRKQMADAVKKADNSFTVAGQQLEAGREKLSHMETELYELQSKFDSLKAVKDNYVTGRMPEGETKRYYSDVNETNRQLERVSDAVFKQQKKVQELEEKADKLETELQSARNEDASASEIIDARINALASEIRGKWIAYFYRMKFADEVFLQIAMDFWTEERLIIEVFLKEIHDSEHYKKYKDYSAFEVSKDKLRVRVSKQTVAYISVEDNVITYIGSKEPLIKDSKDEDDDKKDEAGEDS